jgi:hypothetical protein
MPEVTINATITACAPSEAMKLLRWIGYKLRSKPARVGVLAARDAPGYEGVYAVKILLIEFGELRRVALRRFDQQLFVRCVLKNLQSALRKKPF